MWAYFIYITSLLVIAFAYYYCCIRYDLFPTPPPGAMTSWFYIPCSDQKFSHLEFFEQVYKKEQNKNYITVASISWEPNNYYNWDPSKVLTDTRTWYPEEHAPDLADPQKQKSENRAVEEKITPPEVFARLHFANKKIGQVPPESLQSFLEADHVVSPTSQSCGLLLILTERNDVTPEKFLFHLADAKKTAVVCGKFPVIADELAVYVDRGNINEHLKPAMPKLKKTFCPKQFKVIG